MGGVPGQIYEIWELNGAEVNGCVSLGLNGS